MFHIKMLITIGEPIDRERAVVPTPSFSGIAVAGEKAVGLHIADERHHPNPGAGDWRSRGGPQLSYERFSSRHLYYRMVFLVGTREEDRRERGSKGVPLDIERDHGGVDRDGEPALPVERLPAASRGVETRPRVFL